MTLIEAAKHRLFTNLDTVFPEIQAMKNPASKVCWAVGYYKANNTTEKEILKECSNMSLAEEFVRWKKSQ